MEIRINIEKRHVYFLISIILIFSFVNFAIAVVPNPGHKASEVGGATDDERTFAGSATELFTFPGLVSVFGKVGIGTTSPQYKLDIIGETRIKGTGAPQNTGEGLRFGSQDSGYKWIQSYEGKPLILNPLGNAVGIGTTTPRNDIGWASALDVNGQIRGAKYYDNDVNYYADLNVGGNLGGNWRFSGKIATDGYDPTTNSKGWAWGMGVHTWDVFAEGSIFAKSQIITDGNIDAPYNNWGNCYWSAGDGMHDIDTDYGYATTLCNNGYYVAGIKFKNGGENDELDFWNLYCCKI